MPLLLNGKVVLITGASRGIGAACAHAFARRGAQLSLAARSPIDHPDALTTVGDITDPATRALLIERTMERFGRIDILINNAGQGAYQPTATATDSDTRRIFELNFFAPLALIQLAVPQMRAQGGGTIVNVSSIAGEVALPWMTLYSASKSAILSLTNGLRRELKTSNIHCLAALPGYVTTEFHGNAIGTPPPRLAAFMKYAITPEHCAEAIARGVERQARTVIAPWWGGPFIALERLLPSVVDSRLSRMSL